MAEDNTSSRIGRREFLAGAAAAATAFTIVRPSAVRGSEANSTIELGLIGCGGRGNWITALFDKHGKYKWVACADYYPDRAEKTGEKCKIDGSRRYSTLSGYKKLLDGKLDAVVIESPPYFHPGQAAAAVAAGKHVYLAKPIAIDVPGCQTVEESGKKATDKKLVFLVDFQTRANEFYREAAKRVHRGDIGKLVTGFAAYPCGVISKDAPKTPEDRLRHWYCTREISGDFIVEQSIHALDVMTWFLDAAPISAYGLGASKGLRTYGNIWDNFNVTFKFPKDIATSFYCEQMCHGSPNEIPCRIYGKNGTFDSDYFTHVRIDSPNKAYAGGKFTHVLDLYTSGTEVNIKEFYEAITGSLCDNMTVPQAVRSNLVAVLGRSAAYKGGLMTWDEMMKSPERLEPDLKGLNA